mmetsp:Transcript_28071/g.91023  ORF Transcript_28071/g.91023 Transcript_28071/m.91023 type:complete len:656 (-) Transcript_28071:213-2180(-)
MLGKKTRDAALGFGCSLGFLLFVFKFNEIVQEYKARKRIRKNIVVEPGLHRTLMRIFKKACSKREVGTVIMLCTSLLLRTMGSVWVARHWGKMVKMLVTRNFRDMQRLVVQFAGTSVFLSILNALLKYYIAKLREEVREKITLWCHDKYMRKNDMIFYKANKVGDDKIEHCDHQITSDVDKFSEMFSQVLSQSLKPIVDFIVYSVDLSRVQGLTTPLTLYGWFAIASCISTVSLPPYGELAAQEQRLEGMFRGVHSELITNCEQVAFLGGEVPEKDRLNESFARVLRHLSKTTAMNFNSEILRQYLNKYFVTVIGLFLVSRPVRLGLNGIDKYTPDMIAQYFSSTWKNMEAMSTSIQDLFELTNRIGRLSGLASRVDHLMCGLETRNPVLEKEIQTAKQGAFPPTFKHGEDLKFENVSVFRPDGTLLVKDLNFEVQRGMRVLVTGGNGCGKSSLFRVIRKLWPLVSGTITMPAEKEIYFLTQVNFVPVGTLRDLVTYPDSRQTMEKEGRTDEEILECLRWAHCSPEVLHEDGRADLEFFQEGKVIRPKLDDTRDWQKDLSPGQKQKIAFARLFYHRPSFVVLDECTNGISPDVEQEIYDRCTQMNLGIFSISHKIELKEFHDWELHYKGDSVGGWEMFKCSETRGKYMGNQSRGH